MAYLILTRAGLESFENEVNNPGKSIWVNPGLLSDAETEALQSRGVQVSALNQFVDSSSLVGIEAALESIGAQENGPVWVERIARRDDRLSALPASLAPTSPRRNLPEKRRSSFHAVGGRLAEFSARAWSGIKKLSGPEGPVIILPYMGYGTADRLWLTGRVLQDEGFAVQNEADKSWRNLIELYKRLESDEVPGASLIARFQSGGELSEQEIVADRKGYFFVDMRLARPLNNSGWHDIELELTGPARAAAKGVRAQAKVLIPPASAKFGVISDIDDTVLWTNVTNKPKMLLMLARSNAHTRKPFKGVAAFYRALHEGTSGDESNPVFYVSSSPWHLYTPLTDFLELQGIPIGPLLLKQLGLQALFGANKHQAHKLEKIERILNTYPNLPFVLIGDSGEQDPEIYAEVVKTHPQQIKVIYIRNVNPDPSRIEALDALVDEVRKTGAQLILTPDSEFAASHAAAEGLIHSDAMKEIRADRAEDEPL